MSATKLSAQKRNALNEMQYQIDRLQSDYAFIKDLQPDSVLTFDTWNELCRTPMIRMKDWPERLLRNTFPEATKIHVGSMECEVEINGFLITIFPHTADCIYIYIPEYEDAIYEYQTSCVTKPEELWNEKDKKKNALHAEAKEKMKKLKISMQNDLLPVLSRFTDPSHIELSSLLEHISYPNFQELCDRF